MRGIIEWKEGMKTAFDKIKKALCKEVMVLTSDFTKPSALQTDASESALRAVFTQEQEGLECPITYASRKLNSAEKRYTTIERECLAIKWAGKYFTYYLMGRKFNLVTDHAPYSGYAKIRITMPASLIGP